MNQPHQSAAKTGPLVSRAPTRPLYEQGNPGRDHFVVRRPEARSEKDRFASDRAYWTEQRTEAKKYAAWFDQVSQTLMGRIRMLRFILDVRKYPQDRWPTALKQLRADHATLCQAILARGAGYPELFRKVAIAVHRFDEAAQAVQEAIQFVATTEFLEGDGITVEEFLSNPAYQGGKSFDVAKMRGKLFLLTTFDLLFKDDPVLGPVFPLQQRESKPLVPPVDTQKLRPDAGEKPAVPTPVPIQRLPAPPPAIEAFKQEAQERLQGVQQGVQGIIKRIKREPGG